MKLSPTQKHFMRLVAKDMAADGWTPISATVMRGMISDPSIVPPSDLVEVQPVGPDRGRARLTDRGMVIKDYI